MVCRGVLGVAVAAVTSEPHDLNCILNLQATQLEMTANGDGALDYYDISLVVSPGPFKFSP